MDKNSFFYSFDDGEKILSAVRSQSLIKIQELVGQGANVLITDKYGDTLLHKAAWRGDAEIMKYLLSLNVIAIDTRSKAGESPLHLACKRKHKDIVVLLLSYGADINCTDNQKRTPAIHFAQDDQEKPTNYAIPSPVYSHTNSPLVLTTVQSKRDHQPNQLSELDQSLLEAAKKDDVKTLSALLERGANIHATDKYGDTALHKAAWSFAAEAAFFLCQNGADKNQSNRNGLIPFQVFATSITQKLERESWRVGFARKRKSQGFRALASW